MIVIFRSKAHADIILFGDVAVQLLKMMGHSGTVPGALVAEELPDALKRLKQAIAENKTTVAAKPQQQRQDDNEPDEGAKEPPVQLAHRALPLIELLEASLAARCDVMWDQQ